MHFGENQLSPRSISISPLSTTHPPVLQHGWVRASTAGQSRFTLVMDSSRGFGSHPCHPVCRLVQTRLPCGCPTLRWVNQATRMHSPDHSTKGTPSALGSTLLQWPLTAGEYVVSGTLSSPLRGAFHLSLTVLVRYRSLKVFSLGGWSPQLPTRFHVPRGTQDANQKPAVVSTGLSPALVARSSAFESLLCSCSCWSYNPTRLESQLVWAVPGSLATTTGISVDFSSSGY